jgi:hypothetical protein
LFVSGDNSHVFFNRKGRKVRYDFQSRIVIINKIPIKKLDNAKKMLNYIIGKLIVDNEIQNPKPKGDLK